MNFDHVLRKIRFAFVVAAVAMAAFGIASYVAIGRLVEFAHEAVSKDEKLSLLDQLGGSLERSQSALRQYIITGRRDDLERFEARVAEQKAAMASLGESPRLPEQATLERLVAQRTLVQYEVAAALAEGGEVAALRVQDSPRAQQGEAELSELMHAVHAREEHTWSRAHALPTVSWAQSVVAAAIVLLVAMLAWVFWIVRRYERERRRVTRLLGDTEAMGRALAANMADGLITLAPDLTVLDMNAAALQILGYAKQQVVGRSVSDLIADHPGREEIRRKVTEKLADPAAFRLAGLDMTVRRSDGRPMPVQVSLNDVHVGQERRVTALLRDMSGFVEAAEAVHASEQHLREITDTLPVIILEIDTAHRLRFANRACAEFFAQPAEQLIGRTLVDFLGEELFATHAPHVDQALQGSSVCYQVTVADARGRVGTYDMHLIPRRDSASGGIVGFYAFATDITELKRIDQMKTEFISTVSHELRTPLTSIRGSLGLISAGVAGKLPEGAGSLVAIAQNNCDRLIRLINDILDSEKIESGKLPLRLQAAEIAPLVRKALADNEGFAQQHAVKFRMRAPVVPLAVRVDSDRLLQVLTNLLSNAVKFSPANDAVEVRVSGTKTSVRVEVADRGPGIPAEFQRRIFQKFSQADSSDTRARGGTGLGLNISRTLVEKMGGQIGFTSTPGAGSTFFFELPRHNAPAGTAPVPRPPACAPGGRRKQILHVDGDGDIRAVVSGLAGDYANCVSAGSLQDARERLGESHFDLILLETELDDGSGWQLAGELRGRDFSPPVIVFSASDAGPPPGLEVEALLVKAHTTEAALMESIRRTIASAAATQPAPLEI
jgi:PAS domain S-box-containing protein